MPGAEVPRATATDQQTEAITQARGDLQDTKRRGGCFGTIALRIPPSALESLRDDYRDASGITFRPQAGTGQPELCQVVGAIREEIERPGPVGRLYKDALALQLLIRLLRCASDLAIAPTKGGLAAWQLRRAVELLESDLTRTPPLTEPAAHAGLSPTHFCTAFSSLQGCRHIVICSSGESSTRRDSMTDPSRSLTDIALDCGFSSSSQFATAFRRSDGTTPSPYRRSL